MKPSAPTPPRLPQRFLEWYCRPELLEDLQGDLNEYFDRNVKEKGLFRARVIYTIDAIKFLRLYTIRKPKPQNPMHRFTILKSYVTASVRNLGRNALFSVLNIAGLAIAMVLGLILVAMIADISAFDKFHTKGSRIYRLENTYWSTPTAPYNYASTSILAANKVKESATGIQDLALVRSHFDKDIHFEDKVIPLTGLWATPSFMNVFSFELVSGNAVTALKEPNSLVLTEASAKKIFGSIDVVGTQVKVDTANYTITAVVKDVPASSHIRFDMLGSFVTIDSYKLAKHDKNWMKWDYMWQNYAYLLLDEHADLSSLKQTLTRIGEEENKAIQGNAITLRLKPMNDIAVSGPVSNSIGPYIDKSITRYIAIFVGIVILSACFNYTNLSIARALRRAKEVGIRKVVGASRRQVFNQFVTEAVVISLLSLILAFGLFLLVRSEFLAMNDGFSGLINLDPSAITYLYFILFAIGVGIIAGILPALFFSKINTSQVLKDISSVKLFRQIKMRNVLIVFQYSLSLLFIVAVTLAYKQYRYSLSYDLGFTTANIFEVPTLGNPPEILMKEFGELPEVKQMSRSLYVNSSNTSYSGKLKYNDPHDSINMYYNYVDENYIPLHEHQFLAGGNFATPLPATTPPTQIIINEKTVRWMDLKDPASAIGDEISVDGKKLTIVGVVKDFNHGKLNYPIENFGFINDAREFYYVNLKLQTNDMLATMEKIQAVWKKVDKHHPFEGQFHDEMIREAYDKLAWSIKLFGSIGVVAISIASFGLLGMVVFTTETRLREISVRKVLGASERHLIYILGKGFILLLIVSSLIALPTAYWFIDTVALGKIVYRAPLSAWDLLSGVLVVFGIAMLMIISQTVKAARANPATVLKGD